MTVHLHAWQALCAAARTWPAQEALVFPHQKARWSFSRWQAQAQAWAEGLAACGIRPGQHVALLAENRVEWPVVQMACAALGAVFVPLNSHYRRDDLAYVLQQSEAAALFCSAQYRGNPYLEHVAALRPALPHLSHVFCFDDDSLAPLSQPGRITPASDPDAVAALLYTSGTTGFAKGALLTHRAMMMDSRCAAGRLNVGPGDRWTSIIPLFHCAGCILNILGSVQMGTAYVGIPSFDPEALFTVIAQERCTHLSGVPTSYLAMLDHPARRRYDLSSLKAGSCGGADANPDILRRCAEEFPMPGLAQVYGQTEGATLFTCPTADDPLRWETAGLALDGYELRVVHPETLEEVVRGDIGEIQARGPMVMKGYFNMPEASADTLLPDGWLRSGDLGFLRPDGRLVIAGGRLRDMIIRGGENIYPAEIENILVSHPAVAAVAVFGIKDAYYGEIVGAAVTLHSEVTAAALAALCQGRIAKFKIPARFFVVEAFPLTASGKIRKVELRALAEAQRLTVLA
jgi:acyl-CoA synthetase (AMP-forming)/AMP-acid ligase II